MHIGRHTHACAHRHTHACAHRHTHECSYSHTRIKLCLACFLLTFFYIRFLRIIPVCACVCACVVVVLYIVCGGQRTILWAWVSFYLCVASGNCIQVIGPMKQGLYLLSHLTNPAWCFLLMLKSPTLQMFILSDIHPVFGFPNVPKISTQNSVQSRINSGPDFASGGSVSSLCSNWHRFLFLCYCGDDPTFWTCALTGCHVASLTSVFPSSAV